MFNQLAIYNGVLIARASLALVPAATRPLSLDEELADAQALGLTLTSYRDHAFAYAPTQITTDVDLLDLSAATPSHTPADEDDVKQQVLIGIADGWLKIRSIANNELVPDVVQ
jgi:hypothetical protein